jgi:hypothetical protein
VDHIKIWIEHEQAPNSFYELLGVPCLSDDRGKLVSLTKSVTRFLHQYQNHKNKQIVERARRLQLLCARAAYTFSSNLEWNLYDREVLNRMREEYRQAYPDAGLHRPSPDVRVWLRDKQNVASHRIDEVLNSIIPDAGPAIQIKPNRTGSSTSVSSSLVFATSQRPVPPPIPQQALTANHPMPQASTLPANRPNSGPDNTVPDRKIWQLTGLFLTLALFGAIWLLSKGWGRNS